MSYCGDCERDLAKERYQKNKARHQAKSREWFANIHDKVRALRNKPKHMIQGAMMCKLSYCLKHKDKHTEEYAVQTITFLMDWLQYCFEPDMTWENYGTEWEIDHVVPCNRFDMDDPDEVDLCFNWKNLAPLGKTRNRKKTQSSARLTSAYKTIHGDGACV